MIKFKNTKRLAVVLTILLSGCVLSQQDIADANKACGGIGFASIRMGTFSDQMVVDCGGGTLLFLDR